MAAEHVHNGEIPLDSAARSASPRALSSVSASASSSEGTSPVIASGVSDRVAARTRSTMRDLRMSSVGIELAISVLLGMAGGRWLDGKAGTTPWLMLAGICLGFTAGLRSILRAMDRASKEPSS